MRSERPFRAFVSYSHADSAFAARLQRRLEGYRLPRRLASQVDPLPGQAQGRIGPVFRDRADLSAARDLSEAVKAGVAASSALVVVASPDAARSKWVALEIALFRELHSDAPILVALARGEPDEAVPEALRTGGRHPLAADFRKEGDGKRLAFLKIVAGLAGLPLDALIQRDAQRQVWRVTAITAGVAALMVIMALLLVQALRAREESERRRTSAEDMIEKLITEVREELEGTGKVKVMAAVNSLAIDYYGAQGDLSSLPDDSLERRARVLHALGEDQDRQALMAAAVANFAEAHRATGAVLARRKGDANAIFAHAQSEYWLGYAAQRSGNRDRARAFYHRYRVQAEALARVEPGTPRTLAEQSYAHGNLCDIDSGDEARLHTAIRHCRSAVAFMRRALSRAPHDRKTIKALANRLGWLADALTSAEAFDEARNLRREEEALMRGLLAKDPANVELRIRVNWPRIGLAKIDLAQGYLTAGVTTLEACLARYEVLSGELPEDRLLLEQRLRVNLLIGQAFRDAGRREWIPYRDRTRALLKRADGSGDERSLDRFRDWLEKLEEGD